MAKISTSDASVPDLMKSGSAAATMAASAKWSGARLIIAIVPISRPTEQAARHRQDDERHAEIDHEARALGPERRHEALHDSHEETRCERTGVAAHATN